MSRRMRRLVLWGVVGLVGLWLVSVAVLLLLARSAGQDGFDQLDAAQRNRDFQVLTDPATADDLRAAQASFDRSRSLLRNPLMLPLRVFPVVGRQVEAADRLDRSASRSLDAAIAAVDDLRAAVEGPTPRGPERVEVVRQVGRITARARAALADIDPGPGDALIAPIGDAHRQFTTKREEALDALADAVVVTDGLADFLAGPSHYLVLGANNAEMRAGSGMFLSAATLDVNEGRLDMGDVRPTNELVLPPGAVPIEDPDVARNWAFLDPGRDFRNLALTPRFPVSADAAQRMWAMVPGGAPVDGIIAVDVAGLRSLLKAVGPVTVDGVTYNADNVRGELLNSQYARFSDQEVRQDALGDVARAVFDRLEDGDWEPEELASELTLAAQGRHLLVWSSDPVHQEAWTAASVDGTLEEGSLAVSLLNRGGNKLDWFVQQRTAVDVATEGDRTEVTVTTELTNTTPPGQPAYVVGGPQAGAGLAPGEYGGVLLFDVPPDARDLTVEGGMYPTIDGPDGVSRARAVYLRLPAGQSTTITARFTLPGSHGSLILEPTARVPETEWSFRDKVFDVEYRRTVRW